MDQTKTTEILAALNAAGEDAYLWVHTSGDVILWPDEVASIGDDGARAIARWHVSSGGVDELSAVGDYRIDVA